MLCLITKHMIWVSCWLYPIDILAICKSDLWRVKERVKILCLLSSSHSLCFLVHFWTSERCIFNFFYGHLATEVWRKSNCWKTFLIKKNGVLLFNLLMLNGVPIPYNILLCLLLLFSVLWFLPSHPISLWTFIASTM